MFTAVLMTLLGVIMVLVTIQVMLGLIAVATWLGAATNSAVGLLVGVVVGLAAAGGWLWLLATVITSAVLRWKAV